MRIVDMTSKRYGRLMAICPTGKRDRAKNRIWKFTCDCGNSCEIDGYSVRSGKRYQCPTCSAEQVRMSSVIHGSSESPEFSTWIDIQTRCYNPRSTGYRNYGGRGIRVCDRWRSNFSHFLEDMGKRPTGCSIDRINNDGDYEPGNCRWATRVDQANNRRTNVFLTIGGKSKTISQWAEFTGIKMATIHRRFKVGYRGEALIQPLQKVGKRCA